MVGREMEIMVAAMIPFAPAVARVAKNQERSAGFLGSTDIRIWTGRIVVSRADTIARRNCIRILVFIGPGHSQTKSIIVHQIVRRRHVLAIYSTCWRM